MHGILVPKSQRTFLPLKGTKTMISLCPSIPSQGKINETCNTRSTAEVEFRSVKGKYCSLILALAIALVSQQAALGFVCTKGNCFAFNGFQTGGATADACNLLFEQDGLPDFRESQSANPVAKVSLFKPKSHDRCVFTMGSDGMFRCAVEGTVKDFSDPGLRLLLWLRPVNPPADGWYLQRPPLNGVSTIEAGGRWHGVAQIGSVQWPPHERDVVDISVTIVDAKTAQNLLSQPGVVVRGQPVGIASDIASSVIVTLKQ